jgi:hypothetical protein
MKFFLKWFFIVGLNSVSGFWWGYIANQNPEHLLGMVAGVVTWYLIYLSLDYYLLKQGKTDISRKLVLSASLRIPLQLTLYADLWAGAAAIATLEFLGLPNGVNEFLASYSVTTVMGLYLSMMGLLIYTVISIFEIIRNTRKNTSPREEQF